MSLPSWLFVTLPILSLGLVLGGRTSVAQEGVAAPEQKATIVQSAAARGQPAPAAPTVIADQGAASGQGTAAAGAADALHFLPPAPPPSPQTLVDERRHLLRQRREAMFDAYGARYGYMPPWRSPYDDHMERYRDAMRLAYRRQRDASRGQHNGWLDAMCPWSKPQRNWSAQRSYLMQMEQLNRREAWDAYLPYTAIGRPIPW